MKTSIFPCFQPNLTLLSAVAIAFFGLVVPARATLIYDERNDGEFSSDRLAPTLLPTLAPGHNQVRFALTNPDTGLPESRDLDYFRILVPDGFTFSRLIIEEYTATRTGGVTVTDQIAFIALQRGTQFTTGAQPPMGATDVNLLLGYTLIGTREATLSFTGTQSQGVVNAPNTVFADLLPTMGQTGNRPKQPNGSDSPDPIGFLPPLSAGNYVFWAQQTAPGIAGIQLNFVISPIPEPTSVLAILALGGLSLVSHRPKK
jgi:hypothetical protein